MMPPSETKAHEHARLAELKAAHDHKASHLETKGESKGEIAPLSTTTVVEDPASRAIGAALTAAAAAASRAPAASVAPPIPPYRPSAAASVSIAATAATATTAAPLAVVPAAASSSLALSTNDVHLEIVSTSAPLMTSSSSSD